MQFRLMDKRTMLLPALFLTLTATVGMPAEANAQFPPERLENIKALSEDLTPREVIGVMREFAGALGVRCQYCHVGEAGQPLAEFDFPSDEKVTKRKARAMIEMVQSINTQHIAELEELGTPRIEVQCTTCHRGQARPVLLGDAIALTAGDEGIDAAVNKYRELREQYYGSHTYDFREFVLVNVATELWNENRDATVALAELNLEFFPESSPTHTLLGQAYAAMGNRETAIMHLEKAIELNPNNPQAQRALQQLQAQ